MFGSGSGIKHSGSATLDETKIIIPPFAVYFGLFFHCSVHKAQDAF
jgi:hypothetical protein